MKKLLAVVLFVALMSPVAMAGAVRNNVGCGIGTLLFESVGQTNGGWLLQALASMTNSTFTSSFTMTTGTINCAGQINKVVSTEVYEFINANMDDLARDVAMGNGATIDSLAVMLNVSDKDTFSSSLQANFSDIFPNADVESAEVANKIVSLS